MWEGGVDRKPSPRPTISAFPGTSTASYGYEMGYSIPEVGELEAGEEG
jgi:hypothetical protein